MTDPTRQGWLSDNLRHWEELVDTHVGSRFYDVDGFLRGRSSLLPLEREEMGPVAGLSLLHLHCHFGLDSLSWAREGANVVGVDFSRKAVEVARRLAAELNLSARFVESEVTQAPSHLQETFDRVFSSWGVLSWLPDLPAWAHVVAHFLKPGGRFYLAEIHPTALLFERPAEANIPVLTYGYFGKERPLTFQDEVSYTGEGPRLQNGTNHQWMYELGRVVTVLSQAGLHIDFVHEHPFSCFRQMPGMTRDEKSGLWYPPPDWPALPLSFSLQATKR